MCCSVTCCSVPRIIKVRRWWNTGIWIVLWLMSTPSKQPGRERVLDIVWMCVWIWITHLWLGIWMPAAWRSSNVSSRFRFYSHVDSSRCANGLKHGRYYVWAKFWFTFAMWIQIKQIRMNKYFRRLFFRFFYSNKRRWMRQQTSAEVEQSPI